tara:strand:- start:344 stop:562 length:219 start_codon:yes stop_codon:yes gene_type:complete
MLREISVETPPCIMCKETGIVKGVKENDWRRWQRNPRPLIQDIFPYLDPDEREQIMTGTHPKCWEEMFDGME